MRVFVVANTAWYLANFRLNLMRALRAAGHEVVAVAPRDEHASRIESAGLDFAHIPLSGRGTNPLVELRSVWALRRLLSRAGADLVLSYTPKGNIYSALACAGLGLPFVPNVSGLGRTFIKKGALTLVVTALYRLTMRRASLVFFQNQDDMNVFIAAGLVERQRAARLPGSGVDLGRFAPSPDWEPADRRDPAAPRFLLIARLMWDKGVGEFVEAAAAVKREWPQARFSLLGFLDVDNPSAIPAGQVEEWVANGWIDYLGSTDDVRPFIAAADCVVLPSYREGVPRTLLEAAALEKPIVTTDVPGCRDAVVDGRTGLLCKAGSSTDLAAKLLQFTALSPEDRLAMGRAGRAYVEQNFDERIVLRRYLDVVAACAERSEQKGRRRRTAC